MTITATKLTDNNFNIIVKANGVGGETKQNSSSWILKEWKYPTTRRVWGEFSDLFKDDVVRVKELIIEPNKGISYQRHFKRSELAYSIDDVGARFEYQRHPA